MVLRLISRLQFGGKYNRLQFGGKYNRKKRDLESPARTEEAQIARSNRNKAIYDQYKKRSVPIWIEYAPLDSSSKSGVQRIVVCSFNKQEGNFITRATCNGLILDLTENQKRYAELMVDVKNKEDEFWAASNKFKEEQGLT